MAFQESKLSPGQYGGEAHYDTEKISSIEVRIGLLEGKADQAESRLEADDLRRRWMITTVLAVAGLLVSAAIFLITYITDSNARIFDMVRHDNETLLNKYQSYSDDAINREREINNRALDRLNQK